MNGPVTKETLGLGIGWLEAGIALAGLLVVLGLVVESGPELWQATINRTWPARSILGSTLVVVGVFVEVALGVFAAREAKRLEREGNERMAVAEQATAEANERAAGANQKAEEARLALEEFKAPRALNSEQCALVATRLRAFAGVKFGLAISLHDPEMISLANAIGAALKETGWAWIDWITGSDGVLRQGEVVPAIGVGITVANISINFFSENQELAVAAKALVATLGVAGLSVELEGPNIVRPMMYPYAINILIGRKA